MYVCCAVVYVYVYVADIFCIVCGDDDTLLVELEYVTSKINL